MFSNVEFYPEFERSSSFSVLSFCLFILFMGFSRQEYWSGLPFPSPVDHVLTELSTMTRLSWVALHGMAHSFIELDKTVVHVIRLVSFSVIVVFILSALWWRKIRGLWKLPGGRDWLRRKLGLVLIDGAMLSKSLIQIFILGGSKIIADGDCRHEIKIYLLLGRKVMTNLDSILKKQRHYFANKGPSSQSFVFSSSHVWMWELNYKESWEQKNWCFWTVVLEKTLESLLDCKEIQPVQPKGKQSWVFIGRTDAKAETPILWPPDVKKWLIWKDPDAGKYWRWEENGMTDGEMVA